MTNESKGLIVSKEITINAPPAKVWEALVNPELVKQYLFGTEMVTDGKVGSPILYKGEWQGKTYEDKGTILELIPEKKFSSTYWSSMGGLPDLPENYMTVTYDLEPVEGGTKITIIQDNNATEVAKEHSGDNWAMVLKGMKEVVEKM